MFARIMIPYVCKFPGHVNFVSGFMEKKIQKQELLLLYSLMGTWMSVEAHVVQVH